MTATEYHVTITGPQGVVLTMQMDATLRHVQSLSMDDEQTLPLLVVTSVLAGSVEGQLEIWRRESEHGKEAKV
jgi:hypothetical protein